MNGRIRRRPTPACRCGCPWAIPAAFMTARTSRAAGGGDTFKKARSRQQPHGMRSANSFTSRNFPIRRARAVSFFIAWPALLACAGVRAIFRNKIVRIRLGDREGKSATIDQLGQSHGDERSGVQPQPLEHAIALLLEVTIDASANLNSSHASKMFKMTHGVKRLTVPRRREPFRGSWRTEGHPKGQVLNLLKGTGSKHQMLNRSPYFPKTLANFPE